MIYSQNLQTRLLHSNSKTGPLMSDDDYFYIAKAEQERVFQPCISSMQFLEIPQINNTHQNKTSFFLTRAT